MNKKNIESPLAKYDKVGNLACILCNAPIKKQEYWTAHVNGRVHRDNLQTLKRKRDGGGGGGGVNNQEKDQEESSSSSSSKKSKSGGGGGGGATQESGSGFGGEFLVPQVPPPRHHQHHHPSSSSSSNKLVKNLPSTHGNNSNGGIPSATTPNNNNNNNNNLNNNNIPPSSSVSVVGSKPSDLRRLVALLENSDLPTPSNIINDQEMMDDEGEERSLNDDTDESSTSLPEGFFDDPKKDARARGQVWADPEQLEWDKFVREMAVEEVKSTSIQNEDEEESTKSRELDEIEEQMSRWQRLISLEKRAEELAKRHKERKVKKVNTTSSSSGGSVDQLKMMVVGGGQNQNNDDDFDEAEDDEEEFNWRSKKSVIKK